MHTVERGRLRRAQVSAAILDLLEFERLDDPVSRNCGSDITDPPGGGIGGEQVLKPVLYPFHRAAGFSRDIWTLISRQHDLTDAPPGYELSQLMVSGSDTILYK